MCLHVQPGPVSSLLLLTHGSWSMAPAPWFLVHGSWSMAPPPWFLVHGSCPMALAPWFPARGSWPMAYWKNIDSHSVFPALHPLYTEGHGKSSSGMSFWSHLEQVTLWVHQQWACSG